MLDTPLQCIYDRLPTKIIWYYGKRAIILFFANILFLGVLLSLGISQNIVSVIFGVISWVIFSLVVCMALCELYNVKQDTPSFFVIYFPRPTSISIFNYVTKTLSLIIKWVLVIWLYLVILSLIVLPLGVVASAIIR
jgi:hypothetical protein